MSQFIIKNFRKKQAIKLLIVYPSRKFKLVWIIPDKDIASYDGMSFNINEKDFILDSNNIPCYIVDTKNVEVKDPYAPNTINQVMTPLDFDTAISAKVATELFNTLKSAIDKHTISIIIGVIGIVITGLIGYMIIGKLDAFVEQLDRIESYIKLITGGN